MAKERYPFAPRSYSQRDRSERRLESLSGHFLRTLSHIVVRGAFRYLRRSHVGDVMRCMQGTHDEAPIARFRPLSMWFGVEVVERSKLTNRS